MRHEVEVEVLTELLAQIAEGRNADAGAVRACPASTWTCPDRLALERRELFDTQRRIDSDVSPKGCLTKPGMENHDGDHSQSYRDFPPLKRG
jgi:hypothetical protein